MSESVIHVKVLNFGRDNPGFTIEQLKKAFPDDFDWIYREYESRLFQTDEAGKDAKFYLSFNDRSKLLEYEELHDARKIFKASNDYCNHCYFVDVGRANLSVLFSFKSRVAKANAVACSHDKAFNNKI